jgi:pimeloyl-ACP methyl ester carboxylesterase
MATFGLVHGGCHGTWQWGQLVAQLDSRGHTPVCVDLPIADPSLGVVDYAERAADSFVGHDDLIVVGHSLGGFVIPFIAELVPVRTLVFLAGAIQPDLLPGLPPAEEMLLIPPEAMSPDADGLIRLSSSTAERNFYHDLSSSMRAWATSQLRPQSVRAVAPERRPQLDTAVLFASIICGDDQAISPEWSRAAAHDALQVEPFEMAGSHSPFLSRPAELADTLDTISRSPDGGGGATARKAPPT